jgi:hypothetical protein
MANLLSNTTIGGYQSIHTGNIGSYALTSLPSHNHDDRYYTEGESDGRYAYKAGAAGQDFSVDKLSSYYLRNHYSVSTNHSYGMYFDNDLSSAYGIYRESGSWDHPYPDLRIAFHTGIKLGANSSYQGIKFYTDYDMVTQVMSVNNGSDPLGGGNVYVNNSLQAGSSLRAPIFYDTADTGYYGDFASTSVMNSIRFGTSTNNGTLSGAGDWGMRFTTDAGYITFGPANGSYAHIYTDRGTFYFNKDLLVNGNTVWHAGNDGSGSGLDADLLDGQDQSYYFSKANIDASRNIGASTNLDTDLENGGSYGSYGAGGTSWNSPFSYGGVIAFAFTSGIKAQFGFDIRHTQSDYGDLWYRTKNNVGYSTWRTMWHSGNLTNLSQLTNGPGYLTGITSGQVTGALGYTPYNSSNPSGYITSSGSISGNAATATALTSMNISQFTNNSGYITTNDTTTGIFTTYLGNGTSNIGSGYTRVIRNENGTGGNPNYAPILHVAAGDTMWQIAGAHAGQTTFVWRSGYNGAWNTPWWTIYHSGNFTDNSSNWNTAFGWGNHASAGYQAASTAITTSNIGSQSVSNSNYINSTRDTPGSALQYWQAPSLGIDEAPSSDWHNTIRMGHGSPLSYYSNTLAIRMTGSGVGDIYTQTIMNGNRQGWKKHWNDGNHGSGSGLDADLLDGQQGSYYQPASSAITTSNIGSQSVSYATTAGTANAVAWTNVSSRPTALSQFTNDLGNYGGFLTSITAHSHAISDVTGLQTALDGKQASLGFTPYNSTNPSGYITSSGSISGSAGSVSGLTLTSSANGINPDSVTQNQIGYNTSVSLFGQTDGGLYSSAYSSSWIHQIYGDFRTGQIAIRGKNSGSWQAWRTVLDSSNYTSYAPGLTGSGASGTWGINISGSAGSVAWTNVSSRPTNLSQFTNDLGNYGGWQSASTAITTSNIGSQSVSYASTAGSAPANGGNSSTVGGYAVSGSVGANTVVIRDSNGYIYAHYINSNVSESENPTINSFYTSNGDGWLRKSSVAHVKSQLGLGSLAYSSATIPTNNNQLTNGAGYITGINSGNVTTALGFTPYNATNPSGYITSSASISGNAATATNVAWTGVTGRPTALSQFSNDLGNYGGWLTTGGKAADSELFDGTDSIYFVKGNGTNALGRTTTNNSGGNSAGGLSSGFYDGSGMSNMPTSDWYHLIVNSHHNSATSNQYEFQLATAFWDKSNFYVRSISPGDVGPWRTLIHNGNIGSQSVSYATTSQQLNKYGDISGQDWNTYYINGKMIVSSVYGGSGPNFPTGAYNYGAMLSYGVTGSDFFQVYFPENGALQGGAFRKLHYRTGWNGSWSAWKSVVDQEGQVCTIAGSNQTGIEIHSNVGYNQDPLTYFLMRGQADTSWKAFKVRLTGDAGGQDIEFRRIAENGTDSRMWYVPRGGNTVNFDYPIVQPSDSRLKDNITPISTPVDKIKSLRGVEFDWNSGEQVGTHDVGLIAQDVEAVLPEAVTTQEDGYKNLAYTKVIPLLVEAMKEQQAMIEALKAEIELLKNK